MDIDDDDVDAVKESLAFAIAECSLRMGRKNRRLMVRLRMDGVGMVICFAIR
jgi:hypothetical protein